MFSLVNIFGLALSMTVCMGVIMHVKELLSYDNFHPHLSGLYRVTSTVTNPNGNEWNLASTPLPLIDQLAADSSLIAGAARLYPYLDGTAIHEKGAVKISGAFTEPAFFQLFGFSLAAGNAQTALTLPNSIVLSRATADRLFGTAPALGKMVTIEGQGTYQVTGVLQPAPGKSHIQYDVYASATTIPQLEKAHSLPGRSNNWNTFLNAYTYVLLKEGVSWVVLNSALERHALPLNKKGQDKVAFKAQAVSSITPAWDDLYNESGAGSTWGKMWAEIGVAFIILLSASFNFTNLSIARALTRAKEVGVRKVAGATRYQIFTQYLVEAVLVALLALVMAAWLLICSSRYTTLGIEWGNLTRAATDISLLLYVLLFTLFTGILAGGLPAWVLASFKPAGIMKGLTNVRLFGSVNLRKGLVIFQFTLSLVVVIFLWAFYRQFSYMDAADTGFRKDNILSVSLQGADVQLLTDELSRLSGVESITAVSDNFGHSPSGVTGTVVNKNDNPIDINYYFAEPDILAAMGLTLVAGNQIPAHTAVQDTYVMLNEKAVKALSFKSNEAAINKNIWLNDSSRPQIRGVLKDFHFQNMGRDIAPMMLRFGPGNRYNYLNLHVQTGNKEQLIAQVQEVWKKVSPSRSFSYYWLNQYLTKGPGEVSSLGYLAFICVTIASLGLLALVVYTIETRRRELGIRKVMGADIVRLTMLLLKGFLKLLLIAGCIAIPIGYFAGVLFLQNFAYRVSFGIGSAFVCALLLLCIALLVMLPQILRAAFSNPVKALRSE